MGGLVGNIGGHQGGVSILDNQARATQLRRVQEERQQREQEELARERFRKAQAEMRRRDLSTRQKILSERDRFRNSSQRAEARLAELTAKIKKSLSGSNAKDKQASNKLLQKLKEKDRERKISGEGSKRFKELVASGEREQKRFKSRSR